MNASVVEPERVTLYGTCPQCRRKYRLRDDGTIRGHRDRGDPTQVCVGEYQPPFGDPVSDPWRPVDVSKIRLGDRWKEQ